MRSSCSEKKIKKALVNSSEKLNEKLSSSVSNNKTNLSSLNNKKKKTAEIDFDLKKVIQNSSETASYNRPGNRVSFQPTTEFLKHYKSAGISKQGALTTGIKRAASASLCKKDAITRSESTKSCSKKETNNFNFETKKTETKKANLTINCSKLKSATTSTCNQSVLSTTPVEINCIINNKVKLRNQEKITSPVNNKYNRFSQIYHESVSISDCSTVGEITHFRFQSDANLNDTQSSRSKNNSPYSFKKCVLNIPHNISKSVDSVLSHVNTSNENMGKFSKEKKSPLKSKKSSIKCKENISKSNVENKKVNGIHLSSKVSCLDQENLTRPHHIAKIYSNYSCENALLKNNCLDKTDKTAINNNEITKSNEKKKSNHKSKAKSNCKILKEDSKNISSPSVESKSSLKENKSDVTGACEKSNLNELHDLEEDDDYEDEFYMYENSFNNETNFYARQNQIYNNLRAQPSPAFFQPGFYQRSNTPQPQLSQDLINSQIVYNPQQNFQSHHQQQNQVYFNRPQNYYTSWYGSTPSLRIPDRNQNRQSFYFN